MSKVLDTVRKNVREDRTDDLDGVEPLLFAVWIDCNLGYQQPDWEMNSEPKPLPDALEEAAGVRLHGYPVQVVIDGETPRADGFFSNPRTD